MEPEQEYQNRLGRWTEEEKFHEQRHRRLGTLRLAFAIILVVLVCFAGKTFLAVEVAFTGIIVGLFLSGKIHDRVLKAREAAHRAAAFYQAGLNRLTDQWQGKGSAGTEFLDPHHPYAIDLDIFGRASVFELLNTAQTQIGRATLAHWLLHRAPVDEILARQTAVAELRLKLDLREELAVQTADAKSSLDTDALLSWAGAPLRIIPGWARVTAFCFPWIVWGSLAMGEIRFFVFALVAQGLFGNLYRSRVKQILDSLQTPVQALNWLAGLIRRLEKEPFQTPRLKALQLTWSHQGAAASDGLRRMARLLDWLDNRENFVVALIGPFFLLGTQCAFAVEAKRAQFGSKVDEWLRALGEMEALSSLGGYAFEHPSDPFPELLPASEPARLEAAGLGHPLIPEARSVRNDILMGPAHRLLVVSGSNMSGKSTWMRSLGVNVVLALAGAPVRAAKMRLTPLPVGASIRTQDSLDEGISRFYAEIKRLRQIIQLTEQNGRLLFLVDEILQGTNSHDRRIGAGCVVKTLLEKGAMGLITTHDLALTQIVEEVKPDGANYHFEDQFVEGRMSFDYRLRPGIVEKSNALDLMRSIGLDV